MIVGVLQLTHGQFNALVLGGTRNQADGIHSVVMGGADNLDKGEGSIIVGGVQNLTWVLFPVFQDSLNRFKLHHIILCNK